MGDLASEKSRWIGVWKNTRGSILRIGDVLQDVVVGGSKTPHFRIGGTYQTAKGSVPGTEKFPVTGFVTDDQIAFTASFRYVDAGGAGDDDHSLTAWAGQILPVPEDPDKQKLQTLWHLSPSLKEGASESQHGWVIAWSGEDSFVKLSDDPDFTPPSDA